MPSQSANSNVPTYLVDVVKQTCTCPDYELRRVVCKHQEAVLFWLAWEGAVNAETGEVALPAKPRHKTYRQDWRSYEAGCDASPSWTPWPVGGVRNAGGPL